MMLGELNRNLDATYSTHRDIFDTANIQLKCKCKAKHIYKISTHSQEITANCSV